MAQLDRATVCGTVGRRFESCWAHSFLHQLRLKWRYLPLFNWGYGFQIDFFTLSIWLYRIH